MFGYNILVGIAMSDRYALRLVKYFEHRLALLGEAAMPALNTTAAGHSP